LKHVIVPSCMECPNRLEANTGDAVCKITGKLLLKDSTDIPPDCPLPQYEDKPFLAMSTAQVAERLGLSSGFITKCANTQELPGHRIGGIWVFNWEEVRKVVSQK
jgi:excisionase family DNA binding protein